MRGKYPLENGKLTYIASFPPELVKRNLRWRGCVSNGFGRQGDDYILSAEQIDSYQRDGYLTLREVVTEEELRTLEPLSLIHI